MYVALRKKNYGYQLSKRSFYYCFYFWSFFPFFADLRFETDK